MFLIFLMQALFAATFPIGKEALRFMPPCLITGIRFIIAGVLLLAWAWYTDRACWQRNIRSMRTQIPLWGLTTLCYVYLSYVPEFWALNYLTALKTNLLWSSAPFVSALLEYALTGIIFSRMQWLGIVIGTLGTLPIMFSCDPSLPTAMSGFVGAGWCAGLPEAALMMAVMATSYAWFLVKKLLADGYSIFWINGCTMLLGGIASFLTGLIFEVIPTTGANWLWATIGALVLVIASNILGYTIYGKLLHTYSITFLSFSGFLCPIFGALFCYLFLGEQISLLYGASFMVIFVGLYVFYREELARGVTVVHATKGSEERGSGEQGSDHEPGHM